MVKIDGNIDLVFRDGLKDMEILPPSDVWENISPQISKPVSRGFSFRAAAGIAAIVSVGMLAYFVGTRTTDSILEPLSQNIVPVSADEAQAFDPFSDNPAIAQAVNLQVEDDNLVQVDARPVNTSAKILTSGNYDILSDRDNSAFATQSQSIVLSESGRNEIDYLGFNGASGSVDLSPIVNESVVRPANRWMLGAKMSPTYLSSNLKAANNDLSSGTSSESGVLSYTGGISLKYKMGGRLSLQTGLFYSSLGRQISGINSYSGFASLSESKGGKIFGVETATGEIASTNQDIFLSDASGDRISSIYSIDNFDPVKANLEQYGSSLRQSFEYLEVPLIISYKLIDRKIDFNISGGMAYNFLLDNSTYAVSEGSKIEIGTTEELTPLLLSSALGMSMEYDISEKFSFNLEPTVRYFLNSDGRLTSNNPFTFGLFSGFYYRF